MLVKRSMKMKMKFQWMKKMEVMKKKKCIFIENIIVNRMEEEVKFEVGEE